MNLSKSFHFVILFLVVIVATSFAQYFGKNKVQYTNFKWQYLQSEHFDIYFTEGGKDIATFVAEVAEESYGQLRKNLRYDLADRVTIITYNSHNDFGQTNVDLSPPEESVGGFTEFFKNRVVLPYEGEWENFRHVIHHELTHAVMLQMVYGAGVQAIVSGLTQLQLPLWFVEGLAEYESRGWDIESDMFMRDATINGYLPPIPYLSAFLAYKGGQSVWYYIADRYGEEKVGELLGKVKINKSVERGLKQSIGIDEEELTKRWHRYAKRRYWPDIADRKEPEEIAKKITDHIKESSFINTSPSMSNKGDKVAFLSDKDDYFDIYIASAIDGKIIKKLVRGQRAGNLEELHWLRGPGMSWSPDDKQIVFSAKTGGEDALHIVDVKSGDMIESFQLNLDGIYNPAWSPDGIEIAFTGLKQGRSDIYAYNLKTKTLRLITDDVFSDTEPQWSPDGRKLVFASDRGDYVDGFVPEGFKPTQIKMKDYDIYEINADGTGVRRLVDGPFMERTPSYSPDGKYLTYTSDQTGVTNIYLMDLQNEEKWPITNVLTGAFQPSWGGNAARLVFAAFYYAGYDIYLLKNPLDIKPGEIKVEETQYVKGLNSGKEEEVDYAENEQTPEESNVDEETRKYRHFVFDESFAKGEVKNPEKTEDVFLDSSAYILPTGDFRVNNYKVKFSPDIVYGSVGYNQFFGTEGYTNILLSDVLGNHRIGIAASLFGDFRNADYALTYLYLPHKIDIGVSAFHNAYYFWSSSTGWVRDRNFGIGLLLSNPFDRYKRLDYGMTLMGISRTYFDLPDDYVDLLIKYDILSPRSRFFMLNSLTYTKDTTIWGYTGPTNGSRYAVGLTYSPQLGEDGIGFSSIRADWRRYMRIAPEYTFALRLAGGASYGKYPQKFFLGGVPNWINYDYSGGIRVERIEDIYFATFEMPLRGAPYYGLEGNRFVLTNLEFRFPLVRRLSMGFPLPLELFNVGGALFTDMGLAWDRGDNVSVFRKAPNNLWRADDLFASFGFGARMNLGFLLLRVDFAWPTDFYRTEGSAHVLWSLGADF
jgi:Tol biopolymer transport system component